MVNYSQGKIYKIECFETGLVYVGSTCKKYLSQRLQKHLENYRNYLDNKKYGTHYVSSYEVLEHNHYKIILLESCPCSSIDELKAREQYYIDTLECVNRQNPIAKENYRQECYEKNKDTLRQKWKEYAEKNRESKTAYHKQYYEEHKSEILAKMKVDAVCEICQKVLRPSSLKLHIQSVHQKVKAKCPKCDKDVSLSNLTRHIKTVH